MDLHDIVEGEKAEIYLIEKQSNVGQDFVIALIIFSSLPVSNVLSAESGLSLY